MWNMERSIGSIAWAERGEREARSTNLTNASLLQTSGLTRPAGLVLVGAYLDSGINVNERPIVVFLRADFRSVGGSPLKISPQKVH